MDTSGACTQKGRAPMGGSVELLAPAGSMAALHAAVTAGADAVYLGLDSFNARRNADNFTAETLPEACVYAHLRGVRVYVTLNTVIMPSEVEHAMRLAQQAAQAGADAVIVQDVGLAARIKRQLPHLRLHASTQMNVHNEAGIHAAFLLGAQRVTLARELSLDEICHLAGLAAEHGMQVETFAHGALCVCYSGQCLMSSLIGGRSANRGLCAQACRLPYELYEGSSPLALPASGEHLLSPQDLCTIDLLPQLLAAGVSSLKIEGRMKSPDYVFAVTRVYRHVLDRVLAGEEPLHATSQERCELEEAFSRGFTTAYMEGRRDNAIMSYGRPNNRGVLVGRVSEVRDGQVSIACERRLAQGDVLEFWTRRGHFAYTVGSDALMNGSKVVVHPDHAVGKGDRVFRVRSAQARFVDDPLMPRIAVSGRVRLALDQPLRIEFWLDESDTACRFTPMSVPASGAAVFGNAEAGAESAALVLPVGFAEGDKLALARTKAVTDQEVRDHVNRLGQTPFHLVSLEVLLDEGVGVGFSQLHRLRSQALDDLSTQLIAQARKATAFASSAAEPTSSVAELVPEVDQAAADAALSAPSSSELASEHQRSGKPAFDASEPALSDSEPALSDSEPAPHAPNAVSGLASSASATCCQEPFIAAWVTNAHCARAAKRAGARAIYVPALNYKRGESCCQGARISQLDQAGYPKQMIIALPVANHDPLSGTREDALGLDLWRYVRPGKPVFVESLGDALRAFGEGAVVEVGPHVPLANRDALQVAAAFGAVRAWLSPELTLGQIDDLAQNSPLPLGITVSGAQELMVTEHCLLMSQGECNQRCNECPRRASVHHLTDRKGFDFPVFSDALGRSHLYNGVSLDIVHALSDLLAMGLDAFMVDATLLDAKETEKAVSRAVRALDAARSQGRAFPKLSGTTTGHLFRGVS